MKKLDNFFARKIKLQNNSHTKVDFRVKNTRRSTSVQNVAPSNDDTFIWTLFFKTLFAQTLAKFDAKHNQPSCVAAGVPQGAQLRSTIRTFSQQNLIHAHAQDCCELDIVYIYTVYIAWTRGDQPVRDQEPHLLLCYRKEPHNTGKQEHHPISSSLKHIPLLS